MTPMKRLDSIDDEPFDSFKRRHVEHVKIQTSSASLQNDHEQAQASVHDLSVPIPQKKSPRATFPARAGWETQLLATFASKHPCEPEAKTDSLSASHRQLSLGSSTSIRSPVHTNFEKRKKLKEERGHHQFRSLSCNELKTSVNENKSECSHKLNHKLRDLNQRRFKNELLQGPEKPPLNSSQTDPKHIRQSNPTKHQELDQWSREKCKNMVPLSTLLISPKEYFNLSVHPPIAFDREERYNWGHIRTNQFSRPSIIRHQIRVLQMSSQAPIPSVRVQKYNNKTQERSGNLQNRLQVSRKVKRDLPLEPMERISGSERNGKPMPYVEKSTQKRVAPGSQHRHPIPRIRRPRVSQYFNRTQNNNITFFMNNQCGDETKTEKPTSLGHPRVEKHTQTVNNFDSFNDNQESIKKCTHVCQMTKPFRSKTQALKHERSLEVDFDRNSSKNTNNQASVEETSAQDHPLDIESKKKSDHHPITPPKHEYKVNERVEPDEILHISPPPAQAVFSSMGALASEFQNLPSRQPSLNPQECLRNLSDDVELVPPSPPPNQLLNRRKNSNEGRDFHLGIPKIDAPQNSPMNDSKVLAPETPPTSNQFKISSFEYSNHQVANAKEPFKIIEDGRDNEGGFCNPTGLTDSTDSNYREECGGSTRRLARLRQDHPPTISDKVSSNDTSLYLNSESRGEDSEIFQGNTYLGPNPGQMAVKRDQKGTNRRVGEKEIIKNKKILSEIFAFHNCRRRKAFHIFPSYFSTRPSLLSFLKDN